MPDARPDADPRAILSVTGLTFRYDGPAAEGAERRGITLDALELRGGESLAVLGPSGCGKTTLLHLLAGLLRPAAGSVTIAGEDIFAMGAAQLDRFRGRHIGMVFQRLFLLPALNVRQNVELAGRLARKPVPHERTDALLARLGIAECAQQAPRTLSQGQAQRVAIARALVHGPDLVLADEPTSALDDESADAALGLLRGAVADAGAGLLVVTHDQRVRGKLDRELELAQPA